jgi:phosphate/sulfate permease
VLAAWSNGTPTLRGRLSARPIPRTHAGKAFGWAYSTTAVFIGVIIGISAATGGTTDPIGDGIGAGLFGAILIAIVPSLIVGWIASRSTASRQRNSTAFKKRTANWNAIAARFNSAFYCSRDDLVFDSKLHGSPEAFKAIVWKGYQP